MGNNILVFGTKHFNNSLNEIKEYFTFSLIFYDEHTFSKQSTKKISLVLVDSDVCGDKTVLSLINKLNNKPLLFLGKRSISKNNKFISTAELLLPVSIVEISLIVINLITTQKYSRNSSISIKEYLVDKNERLIKKKTLSVAITEREIQLIELLFNAEEPLSKNIILKTIWKYADDADTHTIETHIYRLRKKISDKFKDENFIINSKAGYTI